MDELNRSYEILELKPGASMKEAQLAYRDLVRIWHPDRFVHDPRLQQRTQEKLKEINNAYEYIKSSLSEKIRKSTEAGARSDPKKNNHGKSYSQHSSQQTETQSHESSHHEGRRAEAQESQTNTESSYRTPSTADNQPWLATRIKKYPTISFLHFFLLIYNLSGLLLMYFAYNDLYLQRIGLDIWVPLVVVPAVQSIQWLFVTWVASKQPQEKLRAKFLEHPLLSILLAIICVLEIPVRIADESTLMGNWALPNVLQYTVYYAFRLFLLWLLCCWISSKIIRGQWFDWDWYRRTVDGIFKWMPVAFRIALGICFATFLFSLFWGLIFGVFKYSGQDLKALGF